MAKKKRKSEGEPSKPPVPPKSKSEATPRPPKKTAKSKPRSRRLPKEVEALLKDLMSGPPPGAESTPRERADALLHRAFEADDPAEVERLAREALEVWPHSADAYALLAEQAKSPKEALRLYAEAVEAGKRDIGPGAFGQAVGQFWLVMETRPYMRALNGLANALWVLGKREEAAAQYREMLRLNPNDNQGVRYVLATCLLEMARDDELAGLLSRYAEDGSAVWAYSAALLAFRREGDSPAARSMLATAAAQNRHVPDLMTGREMIPSQMPPYLERGQKSEAVDYVGSNLRAWRATPGALEWLRRRSVKTRPARSRPAKAPAKPKGPTPTVKKRLTRLPQTSDAVWQAEYRQLPLWINVETEPVRPWFVLVVSRSDELILAQELVEEPPTPALLWDKLVKAMEKPAMGEPHRPAELQVRPSELWDDLEPHLDDVRIQRAVTEKLDLMDELVEQLVAHVCGRPPGPGLLEMPGVAPEQVASFFGAAADFYRAAPWQRVAAEETIKIACDRFESGPWYAAVIGQMGMTLGIALYEDLDALRKMREGDASDEQNARETVALSVTYGDRTEIPVPDLDAATRHGWAVAAPEAYPSAMRKERGLVMRPPLAWELQLLEAALRAIPPFVLGHDRDDTTPQTAEVATGAGPLTVSLSWL